MASLADQLLDLPETSSSIQVGTAPLVPKKKRRKKAKPPKLVDHRAPEAKAKGGEEEETTGYEVTPEDYQEIEKLVTTGRYARSSSVMSWLKEMGMMDDQNRPTKLAQQLVAGEESEPAT